MAGWRRSGRPLYWSLDGSRTPGPWHVEGKPLPVQLEGPHQVANMAAAVAAGLHFGVQEAAICAAWPHEPVRQRGETVDTGRNTVIVDCYSNELGRIHPPRLCRRWPWCTAAILGDMMELGAHSAEGHRLARDVARECGLECWVVGAQFAEHAPGDRTFDHGGGRPRFADTLSRRTILLKGSRSMKLEELVPFL